MDPNFRFDPDGSDDEVAAASSAWRKPPALSLWEFSSYAESVSAEHARCRSTSIDDKISLALRGRGNPSIPDESEGDESGNGDEDADDSDEEEEGESGDEEDELEESEDEEGVEERIVAPGVPHVVVLAKNNSVLGHSRARIRRPGEAHPMPPF